MDCREFLQHSFFTAGALTALPLLFASVGHAGSEHSSSAKKVVIIGAQDNSGCLRFIATMKYGVPPPLVQGWPYRFAFPMPCTYSRNSASPRANSSSRASFPASTSARIARCA